MKILKSLIALLIIPAIALVTATEPPVTVTYTLDNAQSTMTINGGSTVGSWDADVNTILASFTVDFETLKNLDESRNGIFTLQNFSIPVKDIDSDAGNRMTRNIHNYLKEGQHPEITFTLNDAVLTPNTTSEGARFEIETTGTITAAGVSRDVTLTLVGELMENGDIVFSGTQQMGFSDFNIDRPSAMLGTIRASEDLEIEYRLVLTAN